MSRKPVIVVTGVSKGIGLAVAKSIIEQGGIVIGLSRTQTPELHALQGPSLMTLTCDVTDESAFNSAIKVAAETYKNIDGIVLNAGVLEPIGRIDSDVPVSAWREHFEESILAQAALYTINFFSLIMHIRATLPYLRKSDLGGKVIFVSSGASNKGTGGWGPYNCSKAAMNGLCRTLAAEEQDVVSVAVRPGMVNTNMQSTIRSIGEQGMNKEEYDFFVATFEEGRLVKPEDSGFVLASLAIRAPKELSGQLVSWDGDECAPFRRPN